MGRRVRIRGAKATPKKLEREILSNAERMAEDPSILLPNATGKLEKEFGKLLKKLEKVRRHRGEEGHLLLLASKGEQFVRAYAGTISLEAAGKIPFLASARTPKGEVSYAVRGKVDKEKLIALQHFDDPDLRLLAYWDMARKRGMHIYSLEDSLVATESPAAPGAYVGERLTSSPYRFDDAGDLGLRVTWSSAGRDLEVPYDSLKEVNLAHHLMARVAARDPMDDLEVDVVHRFDVHSGEAPRHVRLEGDLLKRYLAGSIDDRSLVDAFLEGERKALRSRGALVVGDEYYGNDAEAFLARLRGSEAEMSALRAVVDGGTSLVLESDRASDAIASMWDRQEDELLAAVASPEVVREIRNLDRDLSPGQMVVEARRLEVSRSLLSDLPTYSSLGEVGSLADVWARTCRVEGAESLERDISRSRPQDHRTRSLAYAFLRAVGREGSLSFQFNRDEEELGAYLSTFVSRMIEGTGDEYDEALRSLVLASGSGEDVVKDR